MATQSRSNTASSAASVKLNRNERTMPKWVTEANDRIGPKPPPPPQSSNVNGVKTPPPVLPPKTKNQPEPDYEVIEFSGQQYANEPMKSTMRSKTPDSKLKCTLCGSGNPWVTCDECAQQIFCASCDDMFHKHPKRKNHMRKAIEQSRPPVPPKTLPGQPGPTPPIAPPRRGKRGFPTPLMQRKDQVNMNHVEIPASPTPSLRSNSWHERVGSLKRGLNLMNRPLPDTPKCSTPSDGSRSTTPKSVFDAIQRPPSVTLEKIKSKACATLDRMAILQQRYRQQKEEKDRNRSGSVTDQNMSFDQWSSISPSPSHFLSGSMSSGINSSHFDLTDDSNFHLFNQRQHQGPHQSMGGPHRNGNLGTRAMSTFNLNQVNRRPSETHNNAWAGNQMQQAQSMAQLNCANCSHHNQQQPNWNQQHQRHHQQPVHPDQWGNQFGSHQQLNRSNLSLNVGAGYVMPPHQAHPHHSGMYPPPVFMNQHGVMTNMYPYPYPGGMPVMNPGIMGMPPAMRSRATSKAGSRVASPTMSRKSMTLRRKRTSYAEDEPTDDEDSDQDDRRSMVSQRSGMTSASRTRQRRMSSTSQGLLDDENEMNSRNHRNKIRDQRHGSVAKSVENGWLPGRRASSNIRSSESSFSSPVKTSRIYSDLDSEGSGTRALVQAKIQQKLEEESNQKNAKNQGKNKRKSSESESVEEEEKVQVKPMKRSMEVQAGAVRHIKKTEKEQKIVQNETEDNETVTQEEEKDNSVRSPEIPSEDFNDDKEESPGLGPPPSTPEHEWECEFCTFVNEPNIKICTICCKTPSKPPVKPAVKVAPTAAKSPEPSTTTPAVKKKPTNDTHSTASVTNGFTKLRVTSSENESDNSTAKKKESLEDIWAALDENIQATADEVTRKAETKKNQKVSTSCSTSPMREIIERPKPLQKAAKEIGTSPPPQSISTQTYDTLPIRKSESIEPESMRIDSGNRIYSNESVQSQQYKPLDPLFIDHQTNEHETLASMDRQLPYYREMSQHNERPRYRSTNDLHYGDSSSHMEYSPLTGLSTRQSSISELLYLQKAQPQMHSSPMHSYPTDLPHYEPKPSRDPETELYILLKEAEMYKFTPEELHAALKYCGPDMHPIQWLRENWPKLIQTVQSLATKYGQERVENTIGTISQVEARDALRLHGGNIWQGVSECIEQRQRKFREISSKGNFLREDIVTALTAHQGNMDLALMDLGKTQLKPFLMRIWGSPGGVENESGASMMLPQSSASPTLSSHTMKSEIHEFLSANASECLQIPNAAGAFIKDNPPQIHENPSNYYHSNHMSDNASSYSVDSKEHASSPFQFDDSSFNNKGMLKDLENLIGNMEQNQAKQNEQVLRSIEGMLENLIGKRDNINETDPEHKRILTKSPITTPKSKLSPSKENGNNSPSDVKNFVWQHIQEIVPNLVQQVEMELMEEDDSNENEEEDEEEEEEEEEEEQIDEMPVMELPKEESKPTASEPPPVDPEEFIMEEVIKPNIKEASIREEVQPEFIYAAEIANFRMEFDRCLQRDCVQEYTPFSFVNALKSVFKSFLAPKKEEPQTVEQIKISEQQNETNLPTTSTVAQGDPVNRESLESESVHKTEEINTTVNERNEDNVPSTSRALQGDLENNGSLESEITTLPENKTENHPMEYIDAENITLQSEVMIPEEIILETLIEPTAISEDHRGVETSESHSHELETLTGAELPIINREEMSQAGSSQNSHETETKKDPSTNSQPILNNSNNKTKKSRIPVRRTFSSNNIHKIKQLPSINNHEKGHENDRTSHSIEQSTDDVTETLPDNNHSQPLVDHEEISNTPENRTLIETVSQLEEVLVNITETNAIELSSSNTSIEPSHNEPNESLGPEVQHSETQNSVNTEESNDSKEDIFQDVDELSSEEEGKRTNIPTNDSNSTQTNLMTTDGDTSEGELYSVGSDHSIIEDISQGDTLNSGSELLLVLGNDQQSAEIQPSSSGVTINSISSHSTRSKANKEFIPSSDPSKQNLSELVSDTQRLIKQMREEINMDVFESSDEEYTDEYSDEYDDEDEYEEGEEEEETGDDLTELDEITENEDEDQSQRTEIDDEQSIEINEPAIQGDDEEHNESNVDNSESESASNFNETQSQNHQNAHEDHSNDDHPSNSEEIILINSTFSISNISLNESHPESHEHNNNSPSVATADSSIHNSEAITETHSPFQINIEHITNAPEAFLSSTTEELNNLINSIPPMTTEVESENVLPEPPLEVVLVNQANPADNQEPLVATIGIETENSLPEPPVEMILISQVDSEANESQKIINEVELENRLPEPPVESILIEQSEQNQRIVQQIQQSENHVAEPPVESILIEQSEQNQRTVQEIQQAENHVAEQPVEVLLDNQTTPATDQMRTTINIVLNTPANDSSRTQENSQIKSTDIEQPRSVPETINPPNEEASPSKNSATSKIPTSNNQPITSKTSSINTSIEQTAKPTTSTKKAKPTDEAKGNTQNTKRNTSKIPKPKDGSPKAQAPGKTTMRSKSFSGPTPIGISSVKAIQREYLSKQSQLAATIVPTKPTQPKIRKNSITEAISKLTKPSPMPALNGHMDGPSTSSGLVRSKTHHSRIPKKKYHETCFSDDGYEQTSEEEVEDREPQRLLRKQSVPAFRTYSDIMQETETVNPELLVRKFMDENLVSNRAEAQIAAALVNMKFQQDVSLWAAKECSDLDQAISFLQQECELCMGTFAMNQIVSMLKCTHKCCKQCAKKYFTVQITDRSINDCNCPFCKLPELHGQNEQEDEHLEYFSNLDIFLKNILDSEVHELFQRKLRDRTLLQDPNFKWCIQCSSGFFARPKQKRLICPDCGSVTCSQCRKTWEKQHEGISCEKFLEWQEANDPEVQAQGVQEHLALHGIDCPKCKFRYSLARGGCMHFTCTQCKFEFCYGCAKPFMMGAKCTISSYCSKLGLHAHHPRNCLFYLRDKLPLQLQFLLKQNGVTFDIKPVEEGRDGGAKMALHCPVALQKDTPTGLVDTICKSEVPDNHAGMCRTHYVEYLTAKVAKARIDPLPIFDLTDCVQELRRRGIALPERGPWDTDEIYKNMCTEIIKSNIPLESD